MAQTHENMSLYELRELATRQQERIETTQKVILNREQKLKYLKQDQNLTHAISEYDKNLHRLKESISAQELKLRQLRSLKAQVQKQRSSNSNLCSELESIRTLFNEKEKELSVALTKVDALTRQLEELRKGNTTNSYHINGISNAKHGLELEKLRQELLYRSKLSEQNGHELMLKRGLLTQRQSEMVQVDQRISELQQRLARKRQLNQQLSSQMHTNLIRANGNGLDENGVHISSTLLRSSVGHSGHRHHKSHTMRPLSANINIAAVEPVLREQTTRISEFDPNLSANKDFMGCKADPKYQTLPYNMKIGVRQQQQQQHQQQYNQTSATNQLCVSTPENDRFHSQLSNEKLLSTNSCLNNDNNNNHNNNVSIITNNINSNTKLLMNTKSSSMLEDRPSPSGSSGSSDRASIPSNIHNGIHAYKMHQQIHNNINNMTSGQHPYQNVNPNPKLFNVNNCFVEQNSINYKQQTKLNHNSYNNNTIIGNFNKLQTNTNQSVIQSHSVPINNPNQTNQSQIINSTVTKVPPNTKPKPIVPPKPSVPVKPIPPPRQSPNHLFGSQIGTESVDMNAYTSNVRNNNNSSNSFNKKSSNLLTTSASNSPINTTNTGYNRLPLTSLAVQKAYNAINSKTGLMTQQLPHHCQQHHQSMAHTYEDKSQSNLNRNSTEQAFNETTDGSALNGPTIPSDIISQTSSLSSTTSSSSLSQNNGNNCEPKSISSTTINTANTNIDNKCPINSNQLNNKIEDRDREATYGTIQAQLNNKISDNSVVINNNNNNNNNDWHKVKRRPVVANNEIEQELAIQVQSSPTKKSIDSIQQTVSDSKQTVQTETTVSQKVDSNQLNDNKIEINLTEQISDKCVDNEIESDINLIKEQQLTVEQNQMKEETTHKGFDSNLMIENNNKTKLKDSDCSQQTTGDNLLANYTTAKNSIVDAKRAKGNLKNQLISKDRDGDHLNNGPNGTLHPLVVSRRVSFDPLALLLDAALEGELELVKKTAKEVPNPSAANDEGITALHNAICAGHFDIVKYLVENGCDVNAQDSDGWTPLHCAASCNNLSMVKFLVEHGACIFATTLSDQETAAEKCEEDEEGFDGCSQYLYGVQEKLGILNGSQVYAVYDYESQNADELSFKEGNVITVMRKGDEQEREWWWARIHDQEGYIPRNLLGLYPRVKPNKELQTIAEEQNE